MEDITCPPSARDDLRLSWTLDKGKHYVTESHHHAGYPWHQRCLVEYGPLNREEARDVVEAVIGTSYPGGVQQGWEQLSTDDLLPGEEPWRIDQV